MLLLKPSLSLFFQVGIVFVYYYSPWQLHWFSLDGLESSCIFFGPLWLARNIMDSFSSYSKGNFTSSPELIDLSSFVCLFVSLHLLFFSFSFCPIWLKILRGRSSVKEGTKDKWRNQSTRTKPKSEPIWFSQSSKGKSNWLVFMFP